MDFVEILKVILFGIVEGFTEWLPISSTGHMILVDEIVQLEVSEEFWNVFLVMIQLGAIMAVGILYFQKLNPFGKDKTKIQKKITWLLWVKIVIACIPAGIMGLLLNDWMEENLHNGFVVACMLILYGILFIWLENRNRYKRFEIQKTININYMTALYIGVFQVLALVPGTSRSGATILGAMLLGCSRTVAAEFSFFLGVPIMLGASLLKILKFGLNFSGTEIFYLLLGMIVAFFVSVYSIKFLIAYVKRSDFKFFGYYRIILGVIVLAYFGVVALIQ